MLQWQHPTAQAHPPGGDLPLLEALKGRHGCLGSNIQIRIPLILIAFASNQFSFQENGTWHLPISFIESTGLSL
jgi:hypothetical protein